MRFRALTSNPDTRAGTGLDHRPLWCGPLDGLPAHLQPSDGGVRSSAFRAVPVRVGRRLANRRAWFALLMGVGRNKHKFAELCKKTSNIDCDRAWPQPAALATRSESHVV